MEFLDDIVWQACAEQQQRAEDDDKGKVLRTDRAPACHSCCGNTVLVLESWESLKIIEECCGHDGRALYTHSTARLHSKRPDEAPDPRRVNVVSHIPCSSTACLFISDFYLCTCGSRSQFLLILTSYALRLLSLPTVHRVPINPCSLQFAFQFR